MCVHVFAFTRWYASIYLELYGIYIVPLRDNYSEALLTQVLLKRKGAVFEKSKMQVMLQAEEPTIEKTQFCLVTVQGCGTTKLPVEAERRDWGPEQAEVNIKSSRR